MKKALFLQCRLDSSRLPGKALLKIGHETVIELVMKALKPLKVDHHILLTTEDSEEALAPLAKEMGFSLFIGPKEDVLERFLLAADKFDVQTIIRATGDNPLVSAPLAQRLLGEHIGQGAHYSGYLGIPLGTGVEILDTAALKTAMEHSDDPYDHEHVSPYLYNHPHQFNIYRKDISEEYGLSQVKVSLDTPQDWEEIQHIFSTLYTGQPISIEALIKYLLERDR